MRHFARILALVLGLSVQAPTPAQAETGIGRAAPPVVCLPRSGGAVSHVAGFGAASLLVVWASRRRARRDPAPR